MPEVEPKADFLQSPLLARHGFRHAFFTRRGGASPPPFESLSFSVAVGDHPEHVAENLTRAARSLGIAPAAIYYLSQVHGTLVQVAHSARRREEFLLCEGDAVLSTEPGLCAAVRSADCVPILLADAASGAVCAVHAGWRGVARRILESSVRRLREHLAGTGELVAAIGPHIEVAAFEVSPEVAAELVSSSPDRDVVADGYPKPHVNLRRIVRAQLRELGLSDSNIEDVAGCTFSDAARFFSFRRDGQRSGRHLSGIVARGSG